MSTFVHDSKTGAWVIMAPSRINRPHDNASIPTDTSFQKQTPVGCPFCPGAESLNTEVFRIGGSPNDSHWTIRVIANKFPITEYHEVILHSRDHEHGVTDLPLSQVELIFQVYRNRYRYHSEAGHGQVLIFNNHDVHAGASIKHPHSQVVVVPKDITIESLPKEPVENIVKETEHLVLYCPRFSQWPYEVWIAPKVERVGETFGMVSDEVLKDLAALLQTTVATIVHKFSEDGALKQPGSDRDVPFNYYIAHGQNWYLRIIPRLVHKAGFELGSGISVNIVDPAQAAKEYQEALASSV